jgi:hypothetical protein
MDTFYETSQARGLKFLYQLSDVKITVPQTVRTLKITLVRSRTLNLVGPATPSAQRPAPNKGKS